MTMDTDWSMSEGIVSPWKRSYIYIVTSAVQGQDLRFRCQSARSDAASFQLLYYRSGLSSSCFTRAWATWPWCQEADAVSVSLSGNLSAIALGYIMLLITLEKIRQASQLIRTIWKDGSESSISGSRRPHFTLPQKWCRRRSEQGQELAYRRQ